MDKLEYRFLTGDIVYINGSVRVISSCDGYYATYYDENESLQEVNVNMIEGIPITPEILEKNGWKKPDVFDSYWLDKMGLLQEDDTWHSALGSTKIAITLGNILYVHQLQHLLFGLGLNSEMEVQVWKQ